jgi:hypothetical protein
MMSLPVNYLILEGSDLSGKTSLYSSLHRSTGFKYNIQDRSCLSMLCYAKLYGRDESHHRISLTKEVSNLNNFVVVLLPPKEEILRRFNSRGDEAQDATSLSRLYDIFNNEVDVLQNSPNVLVVRDALNLDDLTYLVKSRLEEYENSSPREVGQSLVNVLKGLSSTESQINFEMILDSDYNDFAVCDDPREIHYYNGIIDDCAKVIQKEINGDNPYNKPQDMNSRRFYYSSDTCISSIHFLPRNNKITVICTLRSTDVEKNGEIDTRFLAHLSAFMPKVFQWSVEKIRLIINMNSAHIRKDVVN